MSLDVYLNMPGVTVSGSGIFIREGGGMREITRAEWNERFPDREPAVVQYDDDSERAVYSANITHNLGNMANAAGLYQVLWRPDENDITYAHQLIEPLRAGLERLLSDPVHFEQFNPENGWGDYGGLLRFVDAYLAACQTYPQAEVSVWR